MRCFKHALLLLCLLSQTRLHAAPSIDVKEFAALPVVQQPQLSPDGKNILAISQIDNQPSVVVMPYASIEMTPLIQLKKNRDRIEEIDWANNQRVLITTSYPKVVFGHKKRITSMYAVNLDGSNLRKLELPKLLQHKQADLFSSMDIIAMLPDDENHILVQAYTGQDPSPAVFKFDINTGDVDKIVSAAHEIDSWISTRKGEVLFGIKYEYDKDKEENTVEIFQRDSVTTENWESIYKYTSGKDFYLSPISIDKENQSLVVETNYEVYKNVLRRFNLKTKSFGDIIYQVDGYDLGRAVFKDGNLAGVGYTKDYYTIEYFDPELKQRQLLINNTFKQFQSYVYSSSKDKNRLLVSISNANSPQKYYLVDLAAKKASAWLSSYPTLEGKALPAKQPFSYQAKDGMQLNGYFTPGIKGKDAPLIVMPHGGPASRDTMHFDIWQQLLARQGYAILQMNFRGSSGFGDQYEVSGRKQWGKLMQSDIYDAVDWVTQNQLADTNNACMVGWSYGGYAALVAGYQKPDAFKCIVSIAGVSDLPEMAGKESFYSWSKGNIKRDIGDTDIESELADLKANSAINHIKEFKAPVLLIHGENDSVVHYSQSKNLYNKLNDADKDVEFLLIDDGTHNLDDPANRLKAFKKVDDFLNDHL